MFNIEWDSDFHADGTRRRRPKASTMHGWLAKMRGTLLGDERLRSRGIREMKEARAVRQYKKEKKTEQTALERDRKRKASGGKTHTNSLSKSLVPHSTLVSRDSQRSQHQRPQPQRAQPQRSQSQRLPSVQRPQPQRSQSQRAHRQGSGHSHALDSPRLPVRPGSRPSQTSRQNSRRSTKDSMINRRR